MRCPNCNSENVNFISKTTKRGFYASDACCGALLFGWIGLLCGALGANKTTTSDYWVCNNCGRKFQAKQMQMYNQQFVENKSNTPQIEEKPINVTKVTDPKTIVERTSSYNGNLTVEALIKRARIYLEDCEWEKAYEYAENALDVDAECAEAYFICDEIEYIFDDYETYNNEYKGITPILKKFKKFVEEAKEWNSRGWLECEDNDD